MYVATAFGMTSMALNLPSPCSLFLSVIIKFDIRQFFNFQAFSSNKFSIVDKNLVCYFSPTQLKFLLAVSKSIPYFVFIHDLKNLFTQTKVIPPFLSDHSVLTYASVRTCWFEQLGQCLRLVTRLIGFEMI